MPAYVINTRVAHYMGSVVSGDNRPRFAQLYLFDPDQNADESSGNSTGRRQRGAESLRAARLRTYFSHAGPGRAPSVRTQALLVSVIDELAAELRRINPYVLDLVHAHEVIESLPVEQQHGVHLLLDSRARPANSINSTDSHNQQRYDVNASYGGNAIQPNLFHEVAVLTAPTNFASTDFLIRHRGGGVHALHWCHRAFDPLYFVLLFPYGDDGWYDQLCQAPARTVESEASLAMRYENSRRITVMQYYAHRMHWRRGERYDGGRCVLMGGRLLQEYACTALARHEQNSLQWIRNNQSRLRTERYCNLRGAVQQAAAVGGPVQRCGQPVRLPASFTGSPRSMQQRYMDGMAIVRETAKPCLFVTMTCNPKWPEILQSLPYGSRAEDHPEIVARVFNLKLKALMNDLTECHVLGRTIAHMMVVEFQFRGLPHAHILLIMASADRLLSADAADSVVSAELPARGVNDVLREKVLEHMLHNDCTVNSECRCRQNGACKWKFPKDYQAFTVWSDDRLYPTMRRRRGVQFEERRPNGRHVNNRWIATYNPALLLKYDCHINVEVCSHIEAVKYLYKYIYKGPDRASVRAHGSWNQDEAAVYEDMRYFGAAEACWRLFQFKLFDTKPPVQALDVHLDGQMEVHYIEGNEAAVGSSDPPRTKLGSWLDYCAAPIETSRRRLPSNWHSLTYVQFPGYFKYSREAGWRPNDAQCSARQQRYRKIGRLPPINIRNEELFYLRLLLCHLTCGEVQQLYEHMTPPVRVEQLKWHGGRLCASFKEACIERGLAMDDNEWDYALSEAAVHQLPTQLRDMFVYIVVWNTPTDSSRLFENHWPQFVDGRTEPYLSIFPEHAVRWSIDLHVLQRAQLIKDLRVSLEEAGLDEEQAVLRLPSVTPAEEQLLANVHAFSQEPRLLRAERDYCHADERSSFQTMSEHIAEQPSQQHALATIQDTYITGGNGVFFLDAPAGSGKTYLEQALLHMVRADGEIAVAVASTGITALLLEGGGTLHSRWKAPLTLFEGAVLNLRVNTVHAEIVRLAKLCIWEEAALHNRYLFEAVNASFCDIMETDVPFGGKLMVLAGDLYARVHSNHPHSCISICFVCSRQVLPIEQRAGRAQLVSLCMHQSELWQHVRVLSLTENMRVQNRLRHALDDAERTRIREYSEYLGRLGNGIGGLQNADGEYVIELPGSICYPAVTLNDIDSMLEWVYSNRQESTHDVSYWSKRAVVTPRHICANYVNALMLEKVAGEVVECVSADHIIDDPSSAFTTDFLHRQTLTGMPPHILKLKIGAVVMLMRNLDATRGLSNGVRLIVTRIVRNRYLKCTIISGAQKFIGSQVLIPRIKIVANSRLPFTWFRLQFPVKLSYCMTINKSQVIAVLRTIKRA